MQPFKAARYKRKLHKRSGLFKAPPRFVNEVSRWTIKQFASRVLGETNQIISQYKNAEAHQAELNGMFELEIATLKGTNPSGIISAIGFPEATRKIAFSPNIIEHLARRNKIHVPEYAVINHGTDEKPFYDFSNGIQLSTRDSAEKYVRQILDSMVAYLVENEKLFQAPKYTDNQLVSLGLLRERCKELGAQEPGMMVPAIGGRFSVNLSNWAYLDLFKKGPTASKSKDSEEMKLFRQTLRDLANVEAERYVQTQIFELDDFKFAIKKLDKDQYRLDFIVKDEQKRMEGSRGTILAKIISMLNLYDMGESAFREAQHRAYLEDVQMESLETKLKMVGLDKVNVILSFEVGKTPLGLWRERESEIFMRTAVPLYTIRDPQRFEEVLLDILSTARHEIQHFSQTLLEKVRVITEKVGLPPPKSRNFRYTSMGEKVENRGRAVKPHELRDIEFQTNLADAVDAFESFQTFVPKQALRFLVAVLVGEEPYWKPHSHDEQMRISKRYKLPISLLEQIALNSAHFTALPFFKELKEHETQKWRKAVAEFVKEVL